MAQGQSVTSGPNTTQQPDPAALVPPTTANSTIPSSLGGLSLSGSIPTTAPDPGALENLILDLGSATTNNGDVSTLQQLMLALAAAERGDHTTLRRLAPALSMTLGPRKFSDLVQGVRQQITTNRPQTQVQQSHQHLTDTVIKQLQKLGIWGSQVPKNVTTYNQLLRQPIPAAVKDRLGLQGFDTGKLTTVGQLLQQQIPTGQHPQTITAQDYYSAWANQMNSNQTYASQWASDLLAAGLVNASEYAKDPATALAQGFQGLLKTAIQDKQSISQVLMAAIGSHPQLGTNVYAATVHKYAAQMGMSVSDQTANYLASQLESAGITGTAQADMLTRAYLGQMYSYDPSSPATGFSAAAKESVQDMFGQYGLTPSDSTMGSIIASTMRSGADSVYSVKDLSEALAEQQAKTAASALYPGAAQAIEKGQTVQQLMQPYLQTAGDMLGVDANAEFMQNPSKYGFALSGQAPMSISDFAYNIANDPRFDYQHSKGAQNSAASAVSSIRNLLGLT